jgi:hypothetical protein
VATEFLRCFTPSILRLPPDVHAALGEPADLVERAAMRRMWEVGATSYQVVAARVPAPGDPADSADLLVRRRHTLEPGAVIARGSALAALSRALTILERFRGPAVTAALLHEYNTRGVNAGLAPASALIQCFVLAPLSVYAAANAEIERIAALRTDLFPGELGFRFFTTEGEDERFRVIAAPAPFDALDLIRPVAGIHK